MPRCSNDMPSPCSAGPCCAGTGEVSAVSTHWGIHEDVYCAVSISTTSGTQQQLTSPASSARPAYLCALPCMRNARTALTAAAVHMAGPCSCATMCHTLPSLLSLLHRHQQEYHHTLMRLCTLAACCCMTLHRSAAGQRRGVSVP
jgi:hypothetical protein